MKESNLNKRAMDYVQLACPGGVYYKHADRFTSGIPDSTFTWNGPTSWLEFKLLDPAESIHAQLDPQQLVELVKLQHACGRAWVIAFRRPRRGDAGMTVLYEPTALLFKRVPVARERSSLENVLRDLRCHGVAEFEGHCFLALSYLIKATHVPY